MLKYHTKACTGWGQVFVINLAAHNKGVPVGDMELIADCCGAEIARELMHKLSGIRFHIPVSRVYRSWYVNTKFTWSNVKKIASELNIGEMAVYKFIRGYRKRRKEGYPK